MDIVNEILEKMIDFQQYLYEVIKLRVNGETKLNFHTASTQDIETYQEVYNVEEICLPDVLIKLTEDNPDKVLESEREDITLIVRLYSAMSND
jgi:hypothetical protein